jgi:hypothetical protein
MAFMRFAPEDSPTELAFLADLADKGFKTAKLGSNGCT